MPNNKLTKLAHLIALGNRTKAELNALDKKIQDIVTVGGEPNVIETIKLNGVTQTITDKAVDLAIPEYSLVKAADSGDYAAVYNLTKDGVNVGASINIPKDLVVKSGSVDADGNIVLVLNDEANTEIVIDAGSLIEYVTSGSATGDMVVINVSDDHKVTATITDGTITLAKLAKEVKDAIDQARDDAIDIVRDDAQGYADTAESNAKAYADGLAKNYDAAGAAATAESNAKAYADGLAGNYDPAGSAATAEENANNYTDEALAVFYSSAEIDNLISSAESRAKAYTDSLVATDAEVTAALDEVFGTTETEPEA